MTYDHQPPIDAVLKIDRFATTHVPRILATYRFGTIHEAIDGEVTDDEMTDDEITNDLFKVNAYNFLKQSLQEDPKKRASAASLLCLKWFEEFVPVAMCSNEINSNTPHANVNVNVNFPLLVFGLATRIQSAITNFLRQWMYYFSNHRHITISPT